MFLIKNMKLDQYLNVDNIISICEFGEVTFYRTVLYSYLLSERWGLFRFWSVIWIPDRLCNVNRQSVFPKILNGSVSNPSPYNPDTIKLSKKQVPLTNEILYLQLQVLEIDLLYAIGFSYLIQNRYDYTS